MDPNENNQEERSFSDIDDELDMEYMIAAFEYHQQLEQQEEAAAARQRIPRTRIHREFEVAEERLRSDYFYEGCKYSHRNFCRRFRMRRKLFLEIVEGIQSYYSDPLPEHFKFMNKGPDCTGRQGISTLMRCTAAIRQLAYGNAPDALDEYLQMGERTARGLVYAGVSKETNMVRRSGYLFKT